MVCDQNKMEVSTLLENIFNPSRVGTRNKHVGQHSQTFEEFHRFTLFLTNHFYIYIGKSSCSLPSFVARMKTSNREIGL